MGLLSSGTSEDHRRGDDDGWETEHGEIEHMCRVALVCGCLTDNRRQRILAFSAIPTRVVRHLAPHGIHERNATPQIRNRETLSPIRILPAAVVHDALRMPAAIDAMRDAFGQLSMGEATLPLRTTVSIPERNAVTLVMPARCRVPLGLGGKFVSVFPENTSRGLPLIHAAIILLSPETGEVRALVDGTVLTAIRTGAASGLATELLARPDATRLAVIGAGTQARTQLQAVCCVRTISHVTVYSRTQGRARRFATEMAGQGGIPTVEVVMSARAAVHEADVVCVATTSNTPVLQAEDIPAGCHVNAVGSYTPAMVELDPVLLGRSRVFVDQREAALAEAGELIVAVADGTIRQTDLLELGEVVRGAAAGRTARDQVTVFKSVGVATQDLCAADRAVQEAERLGLGVVVEW